MQWTIAAKDSIDGAHEGVGLDVEYCLPGSVDVEAKVINSPLLAFFRRNDDSYWTHNSGRKRTLKLLSMSIVQGVPASIVSISLYTVVPSE